MLNNNYLLDNMLNNIISISFRIYNIYFIYLIKQISYWFIMKYEENLFQIISFTKKKRATDLNICRRQYRFVAVLPRKQFIQLTWLLLQLNDDTSSNTTFQFFHSCSTAHVYRDTYEKEASNLCNVLSELNFRTVLISCFDIFLLFWNILFYNKFN